MFFPLSSIFFICFLNALPSGEYVNLVCSVTLHWSDGNIWRNGNNSPVKCSYLSILSEDNLDIFATSLLMSYGSFLSSCLSSIVMINFYILPKRLFFKCEKLSDARVVSIT